MLRIIIVLVLAAHGIGHSIGVVGGWASSAWGGSSSSWLLSPILGRSTGVVEGALWLLPAIGFLAATGLLIGSVDLWRVVALVSAVLSLVVIALFPQQLPVGSTLGAVLVNAAVLIALLVLNWPSPEAIGT